MSPTPRMGLVSVADYLASEIASPVKREYVGGLFYVRPGENNAHNLIATNVLRALGTRLRGRPCRAFNSDTKVRIRLPRETRFYYPDALVTCRPNPPGDFYQDAPAVVVEVLSRQTRRTDGGGKRDAYLTVPSLSVYVLLEQDSTGLRRQPGVGGTSLSVYVLLEQDSPTAVVDRRTEQGFVREDDQGADAVLPLGEVGTELPLAEIYDGIDFAPELDGDDGA